MSYAQDCTAGELISLVQLLCRRAQEHPDAIAYTFLLDGEQETAVLTYAGLEQRVRAVAAHLQALGLSGERALLIYQPGLDYVIGFLGCLYAGVTAVPAYPPDPFRMERTFPRFLAIANDARPAALLMTSEILDLAGDIFDEYLELQRLHRVATNNVPGALAEAWQDPNVTAEALAFLQYTSGSTAEPKGVMVTHSNLLHNLKLIRDAFDVQPDSVGVIWLPPYHDMGLIGGILEPLYAGLSVVLMSPLDFLQRPFRWLSALSQYKATISGGPNFAYDLCVRKITEAQKASLDLSHWRVAFNGAEPVRKETLNRFAAAFASCGFRKEAFYPCYGLAEATLIVSGGNVECPPAYLMVSASALGAGCVVPSVEGAEDTITLVGCGAALDTQEIVIVNPETLAPCAADQIGEVWVAGDSVAQGYFQRPGETSATFAAHLPGSSRSFLRTGDLGFFHAGELFIAGRIKDLIIIDGLNRYPQDIELTVEQAHPAIRPGCTAAFAVTVAEAEQLVVVAEIGKGYKAIPANAVATADHPEWVDPAAVKAAVRQAIAENHDLRVNAIVLLRPGSVPKTSSGKIQRRATCAGYLAGTLDIWQ